MTAEKSPRPLIVIQVQFAPNATSRPIGIPIDADEWEGALDDAVVQIKMAVMRWQIASLRAAPVEAPPSAPVETPPDEATP